MRPLLRSLTVMCFIPILTITANAAGGVGSGGGGTTNPKPTTHERVAETVYYYGGPALVAWLNAQEAQYSRESVDDQAASPYRKLFDGERTIFDVLKETKVELRFSEPCFDSSGGARDGSVHSPIQGAICLSPYTMAPKLNENNVREETLALLIHELSHVLGTTEEEASTIQQEAIWGFSNVRMIDFLVKPDLALQSLMDLVRDVHILSLGPEFSSREEVSRILNDWFDVQRQMVFDYNLFRGMLRVKDAEAFSANAIRLDFLQDYLCSIDPREHEGVRAHCSEVVEKGFSGGEDVVTARTYLARTKGWSDDLLGPEYDAIEIHRIHDNEGVRRAAQDAEAYLLSVAELLKSLIDADIDIIRN